MKKGILGGTFDPVHNGHLAIAEEVKTCLDLTEVVFMPAGRPWMKSDKLITTAEQRMEMVRLAIEEKPYFTISTIEIEREGMSYTVDTIAAMKAQSDKTLELYFIVGWDSLAQIWHWKKPSKLIEMCYLVAVPRPGFDRPDMKRLETEIPGLSKKVIWLARPMIDTSATSIRNRVARGLSIKQLVPKKVDKYIREKGLYRGLA